MQHRLFFKLKTKGTLFTVPVIISSVLLAAIILSAALAPVLATHDPDKLSLEETLRQPSLDHLLGTDKTGRDIFSRLLYGASTTLLSALGVVAISVLIGVPLGLISGYFGGWIDNVIMRIEDVILAFPALLLAFVFVASFGRGVTNAILALGIVYVPMISRLARSLTLTEKHNTYVESARSIGYSNARILFRHILPNCVPTMLVQLTLDIGYAILDLSALSFLGLGVQPPTSDWGAMLEESRIFLRTSPVMAIAPGIAIIITVVSLNILSDGLQMYLDPAQRKLPTFKKRKKLAVAGNG
jgi:peptide/nickel transport system permease protein